MIELFLCSNKDYNFLDHTEISKQSTQSNILKKYQFNIPARATRALHQILTRGPHTQALCSSPAQKLQPYAPAQHRSPTQKPFAPALPPHRPEGESVSSGRQSDDVTTPH